MYVNEFLLHRTGQGENFFTTNFSYLCNIYIFITENRILYPSFYIYKKYIFNRKKKKKNRGNISLH